MNTRRIGTVASVVGLVLVPAPLYWESLYSIPLLPAVLDPFAAMGFSAGGTYPAAVGTTTVAVAMAVLNGDDVDEPRADTILVAGVLGAVASVALALAFHGTGHQMAALIGLAGAAPVFGTAVGVAKDRRARRRGYALGGAALAPMLGFQALRGVAAGGLAGIASLLAAVALVVCTTVLWYSFDRLGHAVRGTN